MNGCKLVRLKFKLVSLVMSLCLICSGIGSWSLPVRAADEKEMPRNFTLYVDGDDGGNTVKALSVSYDGNTYLSLRDLASVLAGSRKQFDVDVEKSKVTITTGASYTAAGGETVPFGAETQELGYEVEYILRRNNLTVDGADKFYYNIIMKNSAGIYDCYVCLTDLALCMDLDFKVNGRNLYLNTESRFRVDLEELERLDYFYTIDGALVGNPVSGEVFYSFDPGESVPMASTTKLMTYIVVMDQISRGKASLEDDVTVSKAAQELSYTDDGVIWLTEGRSHKLGDLLKALLLASSNESGLMLAEHTYGSEEAFVEAMNAKAREIGLSDATHFYNCHGLPDYTDTAVMIKRQNRTSANDMFLLVRYLLKMYPQVVEITSKQSFYLNSMGLTVTNTNPLLYNMDGIVGLKTGTTNKAGYCLVSAWRGEVNGAERTLIAIEFGAENAPTRGHVSEVLMRYGQECLQTSEELPAGEERVNLSELKTSEDVIEAILNHARRR